MTDAATTESPIGISIDRVTRWMLEHVEDLVAPLTFDLVAGGHSCLTFVVTDHGGRRTVLRRPPLGQVLATAHDVVREHRILSALGPTDVPVPRTLGVCEDVSVNDAPFFVMEHVEGVVLHEAAVVDDALPEGAARHRAGLSLVDALVALHAVDVDAVGLGDLSRRSGYLDRQLKRWSTQWDASRTRDLPEMEQLNRWLVANRPEEARTGIVHGDFRLGNILLRPDGAVAAILDWELCTLGDPNADLAYLLRSWTQPGEPVGPHLVAPTSVGGFPTREEMAGHYEALTGVRLDHLDYWMAFNAWRSAAISEGVLRRYLDGKMATTPDDLDAFRVGVEQSARAGLVHAGLLDPTG